MIERMKTKISTPHLSETRSFYQQIFGMKVIEEWDEPADRGVILGLDDGSGEAMLEIYHTSDAVDLAGVSLQFLTSDLDGFVAALPPDFPYEGPKKRPWGATYLYLRDPAGIEVIVYKDGL